MHGHGMEQNMNTTSFPICLFVFRQIWHADNAKSINEDMRRHLRYIRPDGFRRIVTETISDTNQYDALSIWR